MGIKGELTTAGVKVLDLNIAKAGGHVELTLNGRILLDGNPTDIRRLYSLETAEVDGFFLVVQDSTLAGGVIKGRRVSYDVRGFHTYSGQFERDAVRMNDTAARDLLVSKYEETLVSSEGIETAIVLQPTSEKKDQ